MLISVVSEPSFAVTEIILDTNKGSYGPGDTVELTGKIANSPHQLVAIEVKDPSGNTILIRTVQTDSDGNFVLKFKIPSAAKFGNYDVIANSIVNGNTIRETKTITAASIVPEFPLNSGIAIIMALMLSVGVIITTRFKMSGFQEW